MGISGTYAPQNRSDSKLSLLPRDKSITTNILNTGADKEAKSFRDGVILGAACLATGVVLGVAVYSVGASSKKERELQSNTSKFYNLVLVEALVV
jgi:F0F1-type ATP synthase membrane subunit c/vacuolar-type H+-ATPase subunit K